MNEKYSPLFREFPLNEAVTLDSRFVMAPMVIAGCTRDGYVGPCDLTYFKRRADSASMLITGSASVGRFSNAFGYGLGVYKDDQIKGLSRLAQVMKSKGNTAILQIFHGGIQSRFTYEDHSEVYGPSPIEGRHASYPVKALTGEEIEQLVDQFGQAADRAVRAGFDGVEIHGANHYLIQQFFSINSNYREDEWGGPLENRARFALEVTRSVKAAVEASGREDFIVGYRFSPEEIHPYGVGYHLDDTFYLIDQLVDMDLDYIHSSLRDYQAVSGAGTKEGQSLNKEIYRLIDGRSPYIVAGNIMTADAALDALDYGDLVALASAVIVDPDFKKKIREGREKAIDYNVKGRMKDLALPDRFHLMAASLNTEGYIPKKSMRILHEPR